MIEIVVNGQPRQVPSGSTIESLLASLGINGGRVAVELNRQIVKAPLWSQTPVQEGAQLEIVHFVGGG
jgi:sulfur carrier protein